MKDVNENLMFQHMKTNTHLIDSIKKSRNKRIPTHFFPILLKTVYVCFIDKQNRYTNNIVLFFLSVYFVLCN
jgi:hypothetical protein